MKFLENKYYDLFFFIGTPLWSLLLVVLLQNFPENIVVVLFLNILFHGIGNSTTFFRAYLNSDIRKKYFFRLCIVPLILFSLTYISLEFFILLFVLEMFWDYHHTALQTWGLGQLYDAKNKIKSNRNFDRIFSYSIHIVMPLIFLSLLPQMKQNLLFLQTTNLGFLITAFDSLVVFIHSIKNYIVVYLLALIVSYLFINMKNFLKSPKYALYLSTLLFFVLASSVSHFIIFIIALDIFHAIQTIGITWWSEREKIAKKYKFSFKQVLSFFIFFILCIGLIEYGVDISSENNMYFNIQNNKSLDWNYYLSGWVGFFLRLRLINNIMHYWADSFIWSVSKKEVEKL